MGFLDRDEDSTVEVDVEVLADPGLRTSTSTSVDGVMSDEWEACWV